MWGTTRSAEISAKDIMANQFSVEPIIRERRRTTMEFQALEHMIAKIVLTFLDLLSSLTTMANAIKDKTLTPSSQSLLDLRDILPMFPLMSLNQSRLVMPRENNHSPLASLPLILLSIIFKVNLRKQNPSPSSIWASK